MPVVTWKLVKIENINEGLKPSPAKTDPKFVQSPSFCQIQT